MSEDLKVIVDASEDNNVCIVRMNDIIFLHFSNQIKVNPTFTHQLFENEELRLPNSLLPPLITINVDSQLYTDLKITLPTDDQELADQYQPIIELITAKINPLIMTRGSHY